MKVYAMEHDGHYLAGYSVVVAESDEQAEELMRRGLEEAKLPSEGTIKCVEIDTTTIGVTMLWNGDY
jgi:hypothetical protein